MNVQFEKSTEHLEGLGLLVWAARTFGNDVVLASSFGAEDVVLLQMNSLLPKPIEVIFLDTGRLPQETYNVVERIQEKYRPSIHTYFPETKEVEDYHREHGPNAFYLSMDLRKRCCEIRKLSPLKRALHGKKAWITGIRRQQAISRNKIQPVEQDESHIGMVKINPLAHWSEEQVWQYIEHNQIPHNRLHRKGYPSIGCSPCTRPIKEGEDIRSGRWWWESPTHRECGLHRRPS